MLRDFVVRHHTYDYVIRGVGVRESNKSGRVDEEHVSFLGPGVLVEFELAVRCRIYRTKLAHEPPT